MQLQLPQPCPARHMRVSLPAVQWPPRQDSAEAAVSAPAAMAATVPQHLSPWPCLHAGTPSSLLALVTDSPGLQVGPGGGPNRHSHQRRHPHCFHQCLLGSMRSGSQRVRLPSTAPRVGAVQAPALLEQRSPALLLQTAGHPASAQPAGQRSPCLGLASCTASAAHGAQGSRTSGMQRPVQHASPAPHRSARILD